MVSVFFFSSRRRHTRWTGDWSSDVCSSDLHAHLDSANAERRTVVGRAGVERWHMHGDGDDSPQRARARHGAVALHGVQLEDRKSTRLNSSHPSISYAVFCLKKKKTTPMSIC